MLKSDGAQPFLISGLCYNNFKLHNARHLKSPLYGRGIRGSGLLLKFFGYLPDCLPMLSRTLLRLFFGQPLRKQLYNEQHKQEKPSGKFKHKLQNVFFSIVFLSHLNIGIRKGFGKVKARLRCIHQGFL